MTEQTPTNTRQVYSCPYCRLYYSHEEVRRAEQELRRHASRTSTADAAISALPPSLRDVTLTCPRDHRSFAVYVLDQAPTCLVPLIGVSDSGKSSLLAALTHFALSDSATVLGYSVTIADPDSDQLYQESLESYYVRREEPPISTSAKALGLRCSGHGDRFYLLFLDTPHGAFQTRESMENQMLRLTGLDLAILVIGCDALVNALQRRSAESVEPAPDLRMEAIIKLVEQYGEVMDRAAQTDAWVSRDFLVVLTKSDKLAAVAGKHYLPLTQDEGILPIPLDWGREAARRRFSFLARVGPEEWDAMFWQSVYSRLIIRQSAPRLQFALDQLDEGALVAMIAATGCDSMQSPTDHTRVYPRMEPVGIGGLLVRILYCLGVIVPPADIDPASAARKWLRRIDDGSPDL